MNIINPAVLIPARLQSKRFPNKPLVMIGDRPLIAHCARRALDADIGPVFVVTPDKSVADAIRAYHDLSDVFIIVGGDHAKTGTDRCAWAVSNKWPSESQNVFVNMQGDIYSITPTDLQSVLYPLTHRGMVMATLSQKFPATYGPSIIENLRFWDAINDPNIVKVTRTPAGPAFWRTKEDALPGRRAGANARLIERREHRRHVGVYAYPRRILELLASWPRSPTELQLDLEQWRAIDHDLNIGVWDMEDGAREVNVPGDLHALGENPERLRFFTT